MKRTDRKVHPKIIGAGTLSVLLLCLAGPASAADTDEFMHDFLPGEYRLLGQWPGGQVTYSGTLTISRQGAGMAATRHVGGNTIPASVGLDTATADAVPVLRMRFTDRDVAYEETCLIHSDLDNYPRLTCTLYDAQHLDGPAGLEAMFSSH